MIIHLHFLSVKSGCLDPPGNSDCCNDPNVAHVGNVKETTTSIGDTNETTVAADGGMRRITPVLSDHICCFLGNFEASSSVPELILEEEGESIAGQENSLGSLCFGMLLHPWKFVDHVIWWGRQAVTGCQAVAV